MLDLSLALVPRHVDEVLMVLRREMRREQADRREREVACFEPHEQDWIATRGASSLDPAIGGVLGQAQHLGAVGKQRGTPFGEIQTSRIELGEGRNELRSCTALSCREMVNCHDEIPI